MPKLLIKTGEKKGLIYRLSAEEVTIGRDPSNSIVLPDRRVSRTHVRILPQEKDYLIEDLGSTNGTIVNNSRINKQLLKLGDEIKLGQTLVAFVLSLQTTGPLMLRALMSQDMYLAGSFLLLLSTLTIIGTLISDILLAWVDPRIRLGG